MLLCGVTMISRRSFLQSLALTAAGLYVPKVTYFDMGKNISRTAPPYTGPVCTKELLEAAVRSMQLRNMPPYGVVSVAVYEHIQMMLDREIISGARSFYD